MSTAAPALLELTDVTVKFGGVTANDDVNLTVADGAIVALIGPNGAGKTTLFNVITGAVSPTAGVVRFGGEDVTNLDRITRAKLGMGRTFQNLSIVPTLPPLQNVTVGGSRFRTAGMLSATFRLPRSRSQDRWLRKMAAAAVEFVGLPAVLPAQTGSLPYGDRRRLEFARALALAPRLLLLDEPSAGMGPAETAAMADAIRRARDELGCTVFVVEHDMSFVRTLAEHTTVLDSGRVIAGGETQTVLADPAVIDAYLGKRESSRA